MFFITYVSLVNFNKLTSMGSMNTSLCCSPLPADFWVVDSNCGAAEIPFEDKAMGNGDGRAVVIVLRSF